MRLPPAAARLAPRLAAAVLAWLAASSIYTHILGLLEPLIAALPLSGIAGVASIAAPLLVALVELAGGHTLALLLLGVPAALGLPLGLRISPAIPAAMLAVLAAAVAERRLLVSSLSGMRVTRSCRRIYCYLGLAGNLFAAILAGYGAYLLSYSFGSAVGEYLSTAYRYAPPVLGRLLAILVNLYIIRILVFVVTAWLLYKVFTSIAEPVIYAVLASPADAEALVERLVEAERVKLSKGEAWHQKLLRSSLSAILALVSIPLLYGGIDAALSASPSLAANPLVSNILYLLYAASPIVSLAVYLIARRLLGRLAASLAAFRLPAPSAGPAILLAILAVAAAVLIAGVGPTARMLAAPLTCPFTGGCHPAEPQPLLAIGVKLRQVFTRAANDAAGIVRLINALVTQAFQG